MTTGKTHDINIHPRFINYFEKFNKDDIAFEFYFVTSDCNFDHFKHKLMDSNAYNEKVKCLNDEIIKATKHSTVTQLQLELYNLKCAWDL